MSCALSLVACTSMRPVADLAETAGGAPRSAAERVRPQDELRITMRDGRQLDLIVSAASAETITGKSSDSAALFNVPAEQIQRIERRESDRMKTTWLAVTIGALLLAVGYALSHIAVMPGP